MVDKEIQMAYLEKLAQIGKKMRILHIEDDVALQQELMLLLSDIFDFITFARDGLEGLASFEKNDFDLVITDIKMPKMDGIEMIEQMRKLKPSQHIIVTSAYNEIEYLTKLINLQVNGFILKPLDSNAMFQTLYRSVRHIEDEKELEAKTKELSILNENLEKEAINKNLTYKKECSRANIYKEAFDKLNNYLVITKDKKIKSCNKNFANLLNFSEDELANKPLKSLLSAKNNPNTVDDFFKQLNLESSWQGELTLSSSLFNPIYTLAHAEPLRVENEPAEMMISFTDISIFLNEVEKLRSSLDRCLENLSLGKYLDILPVAAFVLSRDGGVLKINQEASEMIKESSKSGLFKAFHEEKLKLCDFLEFESLDMVGGGFFNLGKSSSTFNCYHETILGKLKARAKIKTLSEEENTLIVLLDYQGFGDDTF